MRIITLLRNLLFAVAALSFTACGNDPIDPEITLEVSPAKVLLESGDGASNTFEITCNGAWTVTEGADWFESSDGSGVNDKVVTVTATSENPSTEPRSASVTVKAGDITRTVTVEQAGAEETPEIEIYDLEADAGTEGVVFSLSDTQEGVSYTLLYEGEPVGTELEGTGSAAQFEGNFTGEGVYTARSITGEFPQTDMNGSFTVTVSTHIPTVIYYATEDNDMSDPDIYKYNLLTGAETKLGRITTNLQCMEYIDGTMYGITYNNSGSNDLVTVDMSTGALTTVKSGITADGIGLAHNEVDGKTYVSTWDKKFGSIDLTTGTYTNISTVPYIFTIAIDNVGVCYAQSLWDYNGDHLSRFGTLDLADGSYTEITTYEEEVDYVQNMSVDRKTNDLYWMQRLDIEDRDSKATLVKMDKATGEYTEIDSFDKPIQSMAIVNEVDPVDVYEVAPTAE